MTPKPPPRQPPAPEREAEAAPQAAPQDDPETQASPGVEATTEEEADPYDELWDPDMDTRPERIKRTKARQRPVPGSRGRPAPKGRRRDDV
jgi:hypothetical protein